jgi:hypothetical protein
MPAMLEDVRETLGGKSRQRWMPWRRKSLTERAGDVAEQVGEAAGEFVEQVGQTTGELVERGKEKIAGARRRRGVQPVSGRWYGPVARQIDLSVERAAEAAEAAAAAAERAAGAMEYMSSRMGLLPPAAVPALTDAELERIQGRPGKGGPGAIKRGVMAVGERISELSDGQYGLKVERGQEAEQPDKRKERRRARQERRLAEEAASTTSAKWFPWVLGLSLGLVIGMIGVAYWQRHRLQQFWGQTSQRAQHVTEGIRQRIEASRSTSSQATPPEATTKTSPETPTFTAFGTSGSETDVDQQVNGRVESTSQ